MNKLSRWINNIASTRLMLVFIFALILFMVIVLPAENKRALRDFGGITPDTTFFYHSNDLITMAEVFGERGRAQYGISRLRFDIVYPVLYAATLSISMSWLLARLLKRERKWCFLNILPVLGAFFDLLENLFATIVFSMYPDTNAFLLWITPIFSLLKWVFLAVAVLILFDLVVLIFVQNLKKLFQKEK
jgi:hypothetical protein